jgi:hypothetical protein
VAAIPGHMATQSYRAKKVVYWDSRLNKLRIG